MKKRLISILLTAAIAVSGFVVPPAHAVGSDTDPVSRIEFLRSLYQDDLESGGFTRLFDDPSLPYDPAAGAFYYFPSQFCFYDLTKESSDHRYAAWGLRANIISGVGNHYYLPNRQITREEAAVMLCQYSVYQGYAIEVSSRVNSQLPDGDAVSDWAEEAMNWAIEHKIMLPAKNGALAPKDFVTQEDIRFALSALKQHHADTPVNRGWFSYLLYRAHLAYLEENPPKEEPEKDKTAVPGGPGTYHPTDDVSIATQYMDPVTFVTAYLHSGRHMFYPGRAVTREEVAVFLWRYAQFAGLDTTLTEYASICFNDRKEISTWAEEAVSWVVQNNIMDTDCESKFRPKETMSAEAAESYIDSLISLR